MTRTTIKGSSRQLIVFIALVEKVEEKEVYVNRVEKVEEKETQVFTLSMLTRAWADAAPTVAENIQPSSARRQSWIEISVRVRHATKWDTWVQTVL